MIATDIAMEEGGAVRPFDVTQAAEWSRVVDEVVGLHGHLDGLVNNPAVILEARPFLEEPLDGFAPVLDVNVMGVWLGMQSHGPRHGVDGWGFHRQHLVDGRHGGAPPALELRDQQVGGARVDQVRRRRARSSGIRSIPSIRAA